MVALQIPPSPNNCAGFRLYLTSTVCWAEYIKVILDPAHSGLCWFRVLSLFFSWSWTIKHFGVFCHCNTLKVYHPQGSFIYSADFLTAWCVEICSVDSVSCFPKMTNFFSDNMFNFSCTSKPVTLQRSKFLSGFVSLGNSANVPIDIQQ